MSSMTRPRPSPTKSTTLAVTPSPSPSTSTSEQSWRDAVNAAEEQFGSLNVLVNNAGILVREELEEGTDPGWNSTMDVNAKGVYLGMKLAVPQC